ncbi:hypothetical protein Poly51_13100 [Rubripirellula tenax]|uniref:Uncharacterized protein n=1 Tax=Rubripirellula tenax TaxID=2528015 RepID=A0A5C6FG03_9BACT|nr:hypothetical protein [Rubripirellula tenax]TWU58531.1 hypothetical protein Poly51_13100 [Rubripirellula tenax]
MKVALVITGLLAGLALAAPVLVVVGYFFRIIPRLVLTFAPTVFVYSVLTALIRCVLPIESSIKSSAVGLEVAILLGWLVM